MLKSKALARVAALLYALTVAAAQAALPGSDTPISPREMVARMGVGVDVTWSEVRSKIAAYTPEVTRAFAAKGFRHFRLRVTQDAASVSWDYLDGQIRDALANGVIPIIANTSHLLKSDPTPLNQADWVQWWADMAEHYKDYPYELMFDLIVEVTARSPLSDEPIDQLNEAYEQAVTAIRATGGNNAERIIIFGAHRRSDPTKLSQLRIPSRGNGYLIAEFHEGYASGPSIDPTSSHYYWDGTPEEIALISRRVEAAVAWSRETGIPVWEGAWMPGNYNKGDNYDIDRQIRFASDFIGVLNRYRIPHAVNATKKFYDVETNQWTDREPVVDHIVAVSWSPDYCSETCDETPADNPETTGSANRDNADGVIETGGSGGVFWELLTLGLIGVVRRRRWLQ